MWSFSSLCQKVKGRADSVAVCVRVIRIDGIDIVSTRNKNNKPF